MKWRRRLTQVAVVLLCLGLILCLACRRLSDRTITVGGWRNSERLEGRVSMYLGSLFGLVPKHLLLAQVPRRLGIGHDELMPIQTVGCFLMRHMRTRSVTWIRRVVGQIPLKWSHFFFAS